MQKVVGSNPISRLVLKAAAPWRSGYAAACKAVYTGSIPVGASSDLPCLAVDYAEVRLLNGDVFLVEGTLDEVESKLSDAARSGQSRLAWFTEHGSDDRVGVNPAHVASLKASIAPPAN